MDTGSPVSIVSVKCLLNALARSKDQQQTSEDWVKEVRGRLKPTTIRLRSYSGNDLPILKQVQLKVERQGRKADAWIQVQQNAPVDFLLGTDLQAHLGFFLGEKWAKSSVSHAGKLEVGSDGVVQTQDTSDVMGQVCLLEAVRVPAHFQRLVPVEKVGTEAGGVALFTPGQGSEQ